MSATPLPFPNEASSDPVAAALPVGASVAHLTIERVLHEGPYTIVYRASDPAAPQVPAVALMEYFPRMLALRQPDGALRARQAGDAIALSVGREAFVLEAEALERVLHPGVVRVIGSLQAHRTVYRAMELISGPTLEAFVRERETPPSVGEVAALFDALLDALQALHGAGVLHGQLRPDQVLITADRRPVLLGMGSAAAEIAHHAVGPWSAPEQPSLSRHDRITSATDVYLAAATVWYFASGEQPPPLRERLEHPEYWDPAAALARLPDGAGDVPGLKRRLCAALAAALALDPTERPQRVADVRRLLSPGIAPAPFQSATTPLWVGPVPDRDTQWLGPAAAPLVRKPAAPPRLPTPAAQPPRAMLASPRAGVADGPPALDPVLAAQAASDDDDVRPLEAAPARRRVGWMLLPLLAAGAALAWWLQRERLDLPPDAIDRITERAAALPPPPLPAASATAAAPSDTAPAPTAAAPTAAAPNTAAPTPAAPTGTVPTATAPTATAPTGAAPTAAVPTAAGPSPAAPAQPAPTAAAPTTPAPMATVPTGTPPAAAGAEPVAGVATPAPTPPSPSATTPAAGVTAAPSGTAPAAPLPVEPPATQPNAEAPSGEPPAANPSERPAPAPTARSNVPQRRAAPPPTAPRELCSGRSQFSLVYCLQEVCSRPSLRYHAQCIELRRNGDIR